MWSQGSSKYQKQKKCTRSEIPINMSFYVYIYQKKQIFFKFKLKKKKMAKILKVTIKNNIRIISFIPISIKVLIPDLIFPVNKIDREQSEKMFLRNV